MWKQQLPMYLLSSHASLLHKQRKQRKLQECFLINEKKEIDSADAIVVLFATFLFLMYTTLLAVQTCTQYWKHYYLKNLLLEDLHFSVSF